MKTLLLKRIAQTEDGTFGVLLMESGIPWMLTCERPWRENASNVSCIPAGIYECKLVDSPTHGTVFEITGVPGRTNVLIHPGNTEIDTKGCPLLGRRFGVTQAVDPDTQHTEMQPAVLESKDAFSEFMRVMDCLKFTLKIVEALGKP